MVLEDDYEVLGINLLLQLFKKEFNYLSFIRTNDTILFPNPGTDISRHLKRACLMVEVLTELRNNVVQ